MKSRVRGRKGEAGNILVFVIVVLMVASVSLPALLNFSFESLRATQQRQDEMQRFYAADLGVEDALFRLGSETVPVPIAYEMEDVNGYLVSISVAKGEEGTYRITSVAAKEGEPETRIETTVALYDLIISSGAGGTVTEPGEGAFAYPANTVVVLQAVPDPGYDFQNWTGDIGSIANPGAAGTAITMDGDHTIQANFADPPSGGYWLAVNSTAGGSAIVPGEGSFEYPQDWVVDLLAAEDSGYTFDGWTGDIDTVAYPGSNATTILMSGNYTIAASFVPEYTLMIASGEGGYVSAPGEGAYTYESGTVVDLAAVESVGYDFSTWSGDVGTVADSGSASTTVTMAGSYEIQGDFASGSTCRPCFEYALASLSEDDPLEIANNGVVDGDIYGKAGIELKNGAVIDGNAYAEGDMDIQNLGRVDGNAHAQGDMVVYNNGKVDGTAYADGDITVQNNGKVYADGYATGSIEVKNNGRIYGDAHYYGTLTVGSGGSVGGDYPAPPHDFDLPPLPTLDPPTPTELEQQRAQYETEADAGGHYYGDYVVSKKAVVDLGPLHIHGDLTVQNNAEVTLLGTVYVDGDISIANNCTTSGSAGALVAEGKVEVQNNSGLDPVGLPVIMSVYDDIECKNNSSIDAALYAPNGEIKLENNSEIYGAVVGLTVSTSNNFSVTYAPELSGRGDLPQCGCP